MTSDFNFRKAPRNSCGSEMKKSYEQLVVRMTGQICYSKPPYKANVLYKRI